MDIPAKVKIFRHKLSMSSIIGIFSKTTDSSMIEVAGLAGLDFIIIDGEHGPAGLETLQNHVRAALLTDIAPIVRVKGTDAHSISAALDIGALGVQVPNIATPEQATEAVRAVRFHPHGMRGVCRFVRAAEYGRVSKDYYFNMANQAVLILQVEGIEGVNNLDQILAVDGIDVLFIGPYDLSQSVGLPGQVDAKEVEILIEEIFKKANSRGVKLGIFSDSMEKSKKYARQGYAYIAYSVDMNIFLSACSKIKSGVEL